jgi:uncharacterized damage-inducible protein DinB
MITSALFIARSTHHLENEFLPRLEKALAALDESDLWWRPNADTTSIGHLLQHLEGNVRQWILSGMGGEADHRERGREFELNEEMDKEQLFTRLHTTVTRACHLMKALDESALARKFIIQDFETTGLGAIYHIVEHFAWHVGQITWIAKARAGEGHGIVYYDDEKLNEAHND